MRMRSWSRVTPAFVHQRVDAPEFGQNMLEGVVDRGGAGHVELLRNMAGAGERFQNGLGGGWLRRVGDGHARAARREKAGHARAMPRLAPRHDDALPSRLFTKPP